VRVTTFVFVRTELLFQPLDQLVQYFHRVDGRGARMLIEHDLVDELRLMVYPVIVGAGKRLIAETSGNKRLELVEAKTRRDPRPRLPARMRRWSTG
jgi:RibD C-terminal domain